MTEAERREALEQLAAEVQVCTRCRLHEGRSRAVPGEGHPSTEVLFVGEGPGLNEDRQGRPFVGAAGGFLTELLATVGWTRDEVFITNVVKCRPPGNRDPEPDEIAACAPFLRRQAEILDPALVVTLGRHSMGRFMPGARIGQAHGTTADAPPDMGAGEALVFAMYHPAAALHQASLRQTLLDDMAGVPSALLEARRRRDARRAEVSEPAVVEPGPHSFDRPHQSAQAAALAPEQPAPLASEAAAPVPSAALDREVPEGEPLEGEPPGARGVDPLGSDSPGPPPPLAEPPARLDSADLVPVGAAAGSPQPAVLAGIDAAAAADQMTLF